MATDQTLTVLHRRLGLRGDAVSDRDGRGGLDDADDSPGNVDDFAPSWIPDSAPAGPRAWLDSVRADPGRAGGLALAAVAVVAVLVTVFTIIRSHPAPVASANLPPVQTASSSVTTASHGAASQGRATPATNQVVVSVVGLVHQPGLVTVAPDARVADAVTAAGGLVRGADTLGLNLARKVADGEQIVVGIATPAGRSATLGSAVIAGTPPRAPAGGGRAGPVNLNTGTVDQLVALPGVGPVTAAAIVAWRQANGGFRSVDDLAEVDGIGPARLEKLRRLVTV